MNNDVPIPCSEHAFSRKTAPFHLMAKPAGPRCNMACRYCFYTEKESLFKDRHAFRMSDAVLEAYIRGVAEALYTPELSYAWQGGEPTLAGLDFYRRAVALQKRHADGRRVHNALQTNGLALDDEWCGFLAENGFLVGLSLDGPPDIQNVYRVDRDGRPRFEPVWNSLERMQHAGVEFNTLTVVSRANVRRPLDVYRFLRDAGVRHMQFIPLVERKPDDSARNLGLHLATPPDLRSAGGRQAVMPWCPGPEDYGAFLCEIFDEWIRHDIGRVFVQTFEVALALWMNVGAGVCHFAPTCGRALVLEHNGDVYACDHYVYPAYRRGNILERPLAELVDDPAQIQFGADKQDRLPEVCRRCPWLFACNGECPKHRFIRERPESPPRSYLCEGYRVFFSHADPYLKRLAFLLRMGLSAQNIRAEIAERDRPAVWEKVGRNDPCPCGSGRKYKQCHGGPNSTASSYVAHSGLPSGGVS